MENEAAKELVRRGYDALSAQYDEAFGGETKYGDWLATLLTQLPAHAQVPVVDRGCRADDRSGGVRRGGRQRAHADLGAAALTSLAWDSNN
ncbi:hypothetical protein ABZS29_34420 [Kribbella sp. NPDC005582]|uniref:hypothetical protein n=1 Tax=Kribbella sp. NPDC005582 TaxID=3156893 RepID=UPI0033A32A98